MNENDKIRLGHILDSIIELESFLSDINKDDSFAGDKLVRSASLRQLEVIGEACGAFSDEFMENFTEVDWRDWKALRNILIHQYFGVDYKRVYSVIIDEVPRLKKYILEILEI